MGNGLGCRENELKTAKNKRAMEGNWITVYENVVALRKCGLSLMEKW